jgi:hypothetical protein
MPTRYPTDLPPVPADRWNCDTEPGGGDIDAGTAYLHVHVGQPGPDPATTEKRALAYLDHDYQDDLRGAVATADGPRVRIDLARPRH